MFIIFEERINLKLHYFSSFFVMILLACALPLVVWSQNSIKGKVFDADNQKALQYVEVYNIYTNDIVFTDSSGYFEIPAQKGELVEFRMIGYKITRIRLYTSPANFYQVGMVIGPIELDELSVFGNTYSHNVDSVRTAEVFKRAIELQKLEGMDAIEHPLSALSIDNRRIWAFQKRYQRTEREKYIDYVFNAALIKRLTRLGSDSVEAYRSRFMPVYDNLINWNEYEYYLYIKESVEVYRRNALYYNRNDNHNE